jgi:hypothetical protein
MSERRGGPVDLFAVEGQRSFQRSMMVEGGFMGAASQKRSCVTPNTWMNTCAKPRSPRPPPVPPAPTRTVPPLWVGRSCSEAAFRCGDDD